MSDLRPRDFSTSPEERTATRIAALERRINTLERERMAGFQRGYAEALDEVTKNTTGVADLGGPSVTVEVQAGQIVLLAWEAWINPGGNGQSAHILLEAPPDYPGVAITTAINLAYRENSTSYDLVKSNAKAVHTSQLYDSVGLPSAPVPMVAGFAATPGTRTFKLLYGLQGDTKTARFKLRKLWVVVV